MTLEQTTRVQLTARCGIWGSRPQVCRDYPKIDQYMPEECTYFFVGDERQGECGCGVGACCAIPREGGEPGGAPLPSIAGGAPCKHLVWVEGEPEIKEKEASIGPPPRTSLYDLVGGEYGS
jgi:hypothetical protein